jgi:glycosyltransferase involved in cell wall biosynthesis
MKLLVFPRYDLTQASTRVRIMQYLPFLEDAGIDVEIFPILSFNGISGNSKMFKFILSRLRSFYRVGKRLFIEKGKKKHTILHIHSELFPFIPFWIEYGYLSLLGRNKYIIELDDAWFHRYDAHNSLIIRIILGKKINMLMRFSVLVVAGNQYIADRAKMVGATRIEIIPTVVDVEKYKKYLLSSSYPLTSNYEQTVIDYDYSISLMERPTIGWIGSPATTKYLLMIQNVIKLLHENGTANFVAMGADSTQIEGLPIRVIPWSEQLELETLYQFDIGIMPLVDSLFERGKCGYKIIQYMACGLPVVASPVGVNNSIVIHNETGYLAKSEDEWIKYLSLLCNNVDLRTRLGHEGLDQAERRYNLSVTSQKLVPLLKEILIG